MKKDIFEIFQRNYRRQVEEVGAGLEELLEEPINRAAAMIINCSGKLVLTGVGKSGHIAQKLAATFSSTGTPALFMHPLDALHGDLGVLGPDDIILAISKSGESDELVNLIGMARSSEIPVISIVSYSDSRIARLSDVPIIAAVKAEADHLNLAPTASSSLFLIIGDAIAVAISEVMGFKSEDFARTHPAGQIGKHLSMKVGDLLTDGEYLPLVSVRAEIRDVLEEANKVNAGAVLIVNALGSLCGIVTDGDIRRGVEKHGDIRRFLAMKIGNGTPERVGKGTMAIDALLLMENRESQIGILPVVDTEDRPVGLLRLHDLVKAGL